jgi:hypothetical protein
MPLNLIKRYNDLLDINGLSPRDRNETLLGVFNHDITTHRNFSFRGKKITPTPEDGQLKVDTLFRHLTTVIVDKKTRKREFEIHRSHRLHWVKYHIEEKKQNNMVCFSVKEPEGLRTYIYDKDEKYVIVLEPKHNNTIYYLLTAYHVKGKDAKRDKIMKKYKRKLNDVL